MAKIALAPHMLKSLPGVSDMLFPTIKEALAFCASITDYFGFLRKSEDEPSEEEWNLVADEERRTEAFILGRS